MADTTNPLPNAREPFVDRYRFINPVWLRWLKPLLETVKSTTTRVETVKAEVDTMAVEVTETATAVATLGGSWGVAVTVNGSVVAAAKLDGSATESNFRVLADKFVIEHPTSTAVTLTPFTVHVVAGTPTIKMEGEVIVDGSVTADKLNVTELTAVTSHIGSGTVDGSWSHIGGKMILDFDAPRFRMVAV